MRVVRAEQAGACYGVQRALDLAMAAVEDGGRACTLGPLIHNPRVVARLERHGVRAVSSLEDARDDETVVIRSHGVPQSVYDELTALRLRLRGQCGSGACVGRRRPG